MKKLVVVAGLFCLIAFGLLSGCFNNKEAEAKTSIAEIKQLVQADISNFGQYITDTLLVLARRTSSADSLQHSFLRARSLYKKMEWATEYFMPTTSRMVNGPPLPEIENEENKIFEPEGLQVIEPLIYPVIDTANRNELIRQVRLLQARVKNYDNYWQANHIDSSQVFDAIRLEVFRSISLGISGFDVPLAKSSITEAAVVFSSLREVTGKFSGEASAKLIIQFNEAIHYLQVHPEFNSFDRLFFITRHANPVSREMIALQRSLQIPFVQDSRLLRPEAATMFDGIASFDLNAYTPDSSYYVSQAKVVLGNKLFYDRVLSVDNSRSCASCHNPAKAFSDGLPTSMALANGFVKRNAPSLLNAAFQPSLFYDLRTTNLENQAIDVIRSRDEMHGNLDEAIVKIKEDKEYKELFHAAWPHVTEWKSFHIQNALASYVRSLVSFNSRFDQYIKGDESKMSEQEKKGFNLFMGKAKCGTCHFMPLFNGTVPPAFNKIESEVIGVPERGNPGKIDSDSGRYMIYKLEPYLHAFKTTTVRNIALTTPYMHNGAFTTLEEIVDFYNKGGGVGLGFEVSNQTLPFDKLELTEDEQKAIVAFMHSLSDADNKY